MAELWLTNSVDGALDHRDNRMHVEGGQSLGHSNVDVNSTKMKKRRVKILMKQSIITQATWHTVVQY